MNVTHMPTSRLPPYARAHIHTHKHFLDEQVPWEPDFSFSGEKVQNTRKIEARVHAERMLH